MTCYDTNLVFNKLGEYEDNDETLGIDYNTLTKILKNGVYQIVATDLNSKPVEIHHSPFVMLDVRASRFVEIISTSYETLGHTFTHYSIGTGRFPFEKFGKRKLGGWALTKEELL